MGSFIDPSTILALLLMVLGGGVRDLVSCVSTNAYWKAKGVAVSTRQLTGELEPVKPADVSKLIADLDANDPKARDDVTAKIAAVGPAAIPALEESARNGSPEVASRSRMLLATIRARSKSASVRRLMAIRTLGERKDASALPILRTLVDSNEMFVADYAKSAIAKIEGKSYAVPAATEATRAADVALLPSRLDAVAQVAPTIHGTLSIDKLMDQSNLPEAKKASSRQEAQSQIISLLDVLGNVRLDSITWGFYAAPPGQPGNTMLIGHGLFDASAMSAFIGKSIPNSKRIGATEIFKIDADSAILLSGEGRAIWLSREPGGELGLDAMIAALTKGAGDFSANGDLPNLIKTIDAKAPLWAVTKLAPGMREVVGPLGEFDAATLVAQQKLENDKPLIQIELQAMTADPTKATQAVDTVRQQLKDAVEAGRQEEKTLPYLKPLVDFAESIRLEAKDGKATLRGSLVDMPLLPGMIMSVSRQAVDRALPAN